MTFEVEFQLDPMTLSAELGEIYDVTGDEYANGYRDGIAEGRAVEDGMITGTLAGDYQNDRITELRNYALYNCNISSLSLSMAKTIKTGALQGCAKLSSAVLSAAQSVGSHAFYSDNNLTRAEIGVVCSFGINAFNGCANLSTLILRGRGVCTLDTGALWRTAIASGAGYIYVPDELIESYKAATNWSTYAAQFRPLSELEG